MKSPSRSLVIILVSFMINIAFFSSNPTFTSSSEDNKLFTSFNAFPGIITSIILSIGRIIGESAALIFVMGTSTNDNVLLNQSATTLSTHIWMLLNSSEVPNYGAACAIGIIILIIVFILSLLAKIFQYQYYKKIKRV